MDVHLSPRRLLTQRNVLASFLRLLALVAEVPLSQDPLVPLCPGRLQAPTRPRPMGPDRAEVDRRADDLDVGERELGALGEDDAVRDDKGAAVIVEPVAVAALLVGVEVDAAELSVRPSETNVRGRGAIHATGLRRGEGGGGPKKGRPSVPG